MQHNDKKVDFIISTFSHKAYTIFVTDREMIN